MYPWVWARTRKLLGEIDLDAFEEIGKRQEVRRFNSLYLDMPDSLRISLYRVRRLNLQQGAPLDILDIGTGPGVFPYVCRKFGHHAVCTDIETTPYFNDVTRFLELDRRVWEVQRFVPAPDLGQKFDLVVATNIGFNTIRDSEAAPGVKRVWHTAEWDFFLEDLASRVVKPGGRVYLTINQFQRRKANTDGDRALLAHFASRGAVFPSYGHVLFEDTSRLMPKG
jgi:SAM-dependent methyltransferase